MSQTINPGSPAYTRVAGVSSATMLASLEQIEQEVVAVRNKGNHDRVERTLLALQVVIERIKELHL